MLDFPLSVLLQVLKSFCHSIFGNSTNQQRLELLLEIFQVFASGKLPIQQINSGLKSYMKNFKLWQVENLQFNNSTENGAYQILKKFAIQQFTIVAKLLLVENCKFNSNSYIREMGYIRFLTSTCTSTIFAKILQVENLQFNNSTGNGAYQIFHYVSWKIVPTSHSNSLVKSPSFFSVWKIERIIFVSYLFVLFNKSSRKTQSHCKF